MDSESRISGSRIVEKLLGVAGPGTEVAAGYTLSRISCGGTVELDFEKGDNVFSVWLKSPNEDSASYQQTLRFRIGYKGESSDDTGIQLVEFIIARVRKNERHLTDDEYERLFLEPGGTDDLVLSGEGDCLELRITLKCNEKCPFCNTVQYTENALLDPAAVREAVSAAPKMGATTLILTGGEPTLVRTLPDVVGQARALGLKTIVQTNGLTCSTRDYWNRFPALPDTLFVSFHTQFEERVEAITGVAGTFQRKVQAVRVGLDLGMEVVLNFVITTLNVDELGDFPEFVSDTFGTSAAIELSVVAPTERAWENFHMVPRVSTIVPQLAQALDSSKALDIHAEVPEVCGVPMCALPDRRDHFVAFGRREKVTSLNEDHIKGSSCTGCVFDDICIGVWRRYVDAYGFDEFQPVND